MKHRSKKGRKFSRTKNVRHALLKSLTVSLIDKEKIVTTEAKAKELSKEIEPFVTRAKAGTVFARRLLARRLPPKTVKKLVGEIAPRYTNRAGGYTRRRRVGIRAGDGAQMVQVEFI